MSDFIYMKWSCDLKTRRKVVYYCPDEKQKVYSMNDGMDGNIDLSESDLVKMLEMVRECKECINEKVCR